MYIWYNPFILWSNWEDYPFIFHFFESLIHSFSQCAITYWCDSIQFFNCFLKNIFWLSDPVGEKKSWKLLIILHLASTFNFVQRSQTFFLHNSWSDSSPSCTLHFPWVLTVTFSHLPQLCCKDITDLGGGEMVLNLFLDTSNYNPVSLLRWSFCFSIAPFKGF